MICVPKMICGGDQPSGSFSLSQVMVQETLTSYGVLAPKTAHAEMNALLDVYTRNFRAINNYSLHPSDQSVVYFRASETPERFSKLWTKWAGGGIQFPFGS